MDVYSESMFMEFILYNNWANQQVLLACQNLSEDQLAAMTPGAYGTIRETLEHIIRSEAYYVTLLTGRSLQLHFNWDDHPDLAAMIVYAADVGKALVDIAQRIRPTDMVVEEDNGQQFRYHALVVFIQIINHGIEHRTNVTTILNQGLQTPPAVDAWGYLSAHPDRFKLTQA